MNKFYEEFKSCSEKDINEAFVSACANSDFDKVKYLLKTNELPYKASINYDDSACGKLTFFNSHVDIVKYLSLSPNLKEHLDVKPYAHNVISFAKNNKDWEWLEILLSDLITDNNQHLNNLFHFSCRDGDSDTVNYLFNSKWKDKIAINKTLYNDACFGGNVDIIDFLRNNFKDDIDTNDERAFLNCYASLEYDTDNLDIMEYFIFDLNIPYSSNIKKYLDEGTFLSENKI